MKCWMGFDGFCFLCVKLALNHCSVPQEATETWECWLVERSNFQIGELPRPVKLDEAWCTPALVPPSVSVLRVQHFLMGTYTPVQLNSVRCCWVWHHAMMAGALRPE